MTSAGPVLDVDVGADARGCRGAGDSASHGGLPGEDDDRGLGASWGENETCRFANKAYVSWFGRSREELLGTTLRALLGRAYAGEVQVFERNILVLGGGHACESGHVQPRRARRQRGHRQPPAARGRRPPKLARARILDATRRRPNRRDPQHGAHALNQREDDFGLVLAPLGGRGLESEHSFGRVTPIRLSCVVLKSTQKNHLACSRRSMKAVTHVRNP